MLGSFLPEHVEEFSLFFAFLFFLSCLFAPLSLMCNEWSRCPPTGGNRDKEVREREERKY